MIALAILLAAAQTAPAKAPTKPAAAKSATAKKTAPSTKKAPAASAAPQMHLDLSPEGEAVMKKYLGAPDPEFATLRQQLQEEGDKVRAMDGASKLDLAALEKSLREQERLQAAMRKRSNDRLLAMLGEMSEDDRTAFARGTVTMGGQGRPAAKAKPEAAKPAAEPSPAEPAQPKDAPSR